MSVSCRASIAGITGCAFSVTMGAAWRSVSSRPACRRRGECRAPPKTDAQAGEAAGTGRRRDAVERAEGSADTFTTRAISGISTSAWPRFMARFLRNEPARWCRARRRRRHERGIDGEDQHRTLFLRHARAKARSASSRR
jgi:hypothetical protein